MKYISLDIETTAIKPSNGVILSFATVIEDTNNPNIPVENLPYFYCVFRHDILKGEPYALNMNKGLIEEISKNETDKLIDDLSFYAKFKEFLHENNYKGKLQISGKNASTFDIPWLDYHFGFKSSLSVSHRVLDVGSVMIDFKNDSWVPNLKQCKEKANVEGEVTHNALEDCYDIIRVLRTKY